MSTPEFQRIASYANAADADHLKAVLQGHGIRAFVEGGDLQTSLSYIGSALGGVHVTVHSVDAEKAIEIKQELSQESHEPTGGPWFCGECEEIVDAGFQVCWKCGQDRSEVEAAMPATADLDDEEEEEYLSDDNDQPLPDRAHFDESNPYASPQAKVKSAEKPRKPTEINEEAEAMLVRAWRAAIIGLTFMPILANIYSMYMLFAALKETNEFTPEGNWRFNGAFFLNMLSGIAWGAFFYFLYRPVVV
ncbi:hypothetical protein C5Y96_12550 [Blastopirellula marina]|uniref:DUF2007 domain-containing protein n=1 Tax=Blastopirellula marina TaxID=124 RepID=A0A2S8FG71_9BACT|nr:MULTISPECIES: hypothetical protein [Pirellulaceae]PQO31175.1 hypothetical protein C5Y96_12550 [Blastopirellula marina]RCS51569.1 hypothetical protein DTL36_12560 [Bremerella cremea]